MNWIVYFWHDTGLIVVGLYNNYDLESGYMERSIVSRIRRMFPQGKLYRDEAGMILNIGNKYPVHISPL